MKFRGPGVLWSIDRRAGLDGQVDKAVEVFVMRFKKKPSHIFWNPEGYKDEKSTAKLIVHRDVPPLHLWLEIEEASK